VTIDAADGRRHRVVLQRWTRPGWETDDPGFDPLKESAVLAALEGTTIPAPRVIAVDGGGSRAGVPSLLTERLPGRPPTPRSIARPAALRSLAATLAQIHQIGCRLAGTARLRRIVPPYAAFGDLGRAHIPPASRRPDLWRAALDVAGQVPARPATGTLLHRDYHDGNTLWIGDRLTGIVDWTSASWGPPAADLAHLRVDLVVDVSVAAAIGARAAFAAEGGDLANARHHQLRTVFDYLTDTDVGALQPDAVDRLDAFLAIVLDEPDDPS
jgi:aminoglycoside phosphotransferase (APT) family kinase protein